MSHSKSDWPPSIVNRQEMLDFLYRPTTPALVKDIYSVDFVPGTYGSYARDKTACTYDDGSPYSPYLFGRVCEGVRFKDCKYTIRVAAGDNLLASAFDAQMLQLASMDTLVHACTNSDRQTMAGGTWIELVVWFAPFFVEEDGKLVEAGSTHPRGYSLAVGDWVMVQCRLQRRDTSTGDRTRFFTIATERLRKLNFNDSPEPQSDAETLSDDHERRAEQPIGGVHGSSSGGPSFAVGRAKKRMSISAVESQYSDADANSGERRQPKRGKTQASASADPDVHM
ncbi:hypothetical protein K438DRAFT_1748310 [Mycena galopus ATCC 62051]|nr:hypothetical protein K438DRAFT_1748310 [Mycena galopus ATCC 62051]